MGEENKMVISTIQQQSRKIFKKKTASQHEYYERKLLFLVL
jgi:hypothetical protein